MTTLTRIQYPQDKVTYITNQGLEKLKSELEYLRTIKRQDVANHLREALEGDDTLEEGEFLLAKEEQSMVEGRIWQLEQLLSRIEIIVPGNTTGTITLGNTVTIQEDGMIAESYTIVGSAEANVKLGMISNVSPLGRALIGHKIGDEIDIRAPDGILHFRIIDIK